MNNKEYKTAEKKKYEEMTMKELRAMCKELGLSTCSHGNKLRKDELVERIKEFKKKVETIEAYQTGKENKNSMEEINVAENNTEVTWEDEEGWENDAEETVKECEAESEAVKEVDEQTSEETEQKEVYYKAKPEKVYEDILKLGTYVAFVDKFQIEQKGKVLSIEKMRSAKVIGINRKLKRVRLESKYGTLFEIGFDDILWVRSDQQKYPAWIYNKLKERGKVLSVTENRA